MTSKSLVIDSSIETGPVNFTFLNNREEAKRHMYDARKFLASVKSKYGVYDRIAAGDPGGFFHESIDLPDGTRISVSTNDGVDTAIIAAPSRVIEKEEKEEEVEFNPTIGSDFFVGIRYVAGGNPVKPPSGYETIFTVDGETYTQRHVVPHLCLWVPDMKGNDTDERLVVSNRNSIIGASLDDPDEFFINGFISRPHFDIPGEFPLGLFKSENWIVREGVLEGDTYWDVLITHKSRPPEGRYDVKACIVGADCLVTTPAEFEVVMSLGRFNVSKRFKVSEFTAYTKLTMPKGFFWKNSQNQSVKGSDKEVWYGDNEVQAAMNQGFHFNNRPFDYGENPHGPNWWQGGITGYLDHNPIEDQNKTYLNVVDPEEGDNDGKPFLIEGFFNPNAEADYDDPNGFYSFEDTPQGYISFRDRCGANPVRSQNRYWAVLPLGTAGQNVATNAFIPRTFECAKDVDENGGAFSVGLQVFLNLGSSNETELEVKIPGVAPGTPLVFKSLLSGRTIVATANNFPSNNGAGEFAIRNKNVSCLYGVIPRLEVFSDDSDEFGPLIDPFYLSYVVTDDEAPGGPPFYIRAYTRETVVDSELSTSELNVTVEGPMTPYLELGGYAFGMAPILNGWKYEVLEKIYWPAGK